MLHILSCAAMLNNKKGSTCLTCNEDIVNHYDIGSFRNIWNKPSESKTDSLENLSNKSK